jgi:type II secretory pathway component HofQ
MLSERGRLEIDARTNTLIVTDVSERTEAVRAVF